MITRNRTEFDYMKPDFVDGDFKWYIDKHFQIYIENQQAENLPKLKGYGCFIVRNNSDIEDYVLIDHKQNVITGYKYNSEGKELITAFINILKVSKHFDEHEKK